jgi:hypothetical protein
MSRRPSGWSRLGSVAAGEGVAAAIVGAFGTNPLALDHGLASAWSRTSALSRDAARWALGADPLPAFSSVGDVLDARLHALPADVRRRRRVAALIGMTVPRRRCWRPTTKWARPRISSGSWPSLVAAGILLADGTTTTFVHPLARETARDRTRRRPAPPRAHIRAARAILDAAGSRRRRRHAGSAGTHLAEALLLSRDGAAEDPDRVDAIDLLSTAAEHAGEVGDAAGAAILERPEWPPSWRRTIPSAPSCCSVPPRTRSRPGACGSGGRDQRGDDRHRGGSRAIGIDHHVRILRASCCARRPTEPRWTAHEAIADEAYERFRRAPGTGGGWRCAAALRGQVHAARGMPRRVVEET